MFSFVKNRKKFYTVAIVLFILSLLSPWVLKLHEGIDITGGIQGEYAVSQGSVEKIIADTKEHIIDQVRSTLSPELQPVITDTIVYSISGTDSFIVEAGIDESVVQGNTEEEKSEKIEKAKTDFIAGLKEVYDHDTDATITQSRYVNIGASFGSYIKQSGYLTLAIAIIAISIYIMYAFAGSIPGMASWPFAFVTGISMIHDVVIAFGLYVLTSFFFPEFKIDTFFITAMLTILGYSINDSIVIMDRIRTHLREGKAKHEKIGQVIDNAIHSTMRRSLFTSLTLVIVLCAMFFFGPDSIAGFTLALIYGTIIGAYSSIFLAAPLLVDLVEKKK